MFYCFKSTSKIVWKGVYCFFPGDNEETYIVPKKHATIAALQRREYHSGYLLSKLGKAIHIKIMKYHPIRPPICPPKEKGKNEPIIAISKNLIISESFVFQLRSKPVKFNSKKTYFAIFPPVKFSDVVK